MGGTSSQIRGCGGRIRSVGPRIRRSTAPLCPPSLHGDVLRRATSHALLPAPLPAAAAPRCSPRAPLLRHGRRRRSSAPTSHLLSEQREAPAPTPSLLSRARICQEVKVAARRSLTAGRSGEEGLELNQQGRGAIPDPFLHCHAPCSVVWEMWSQDAGGKELIICGPPPATTPCQKVGGVGLAGVQPSSNCGRARASLALPFPLQHALLYWLLPPLTRTSSQLH